jgi:hypothetical protein
MSGSGVVGEYVVGTDSRYVRTVAWPLTVSILSCVVPVVEPVTPQPADGAPALVVVPPAPVVPAVPVVPAAPVVPAMPVVPVCPPEAVVPPEPIAPAEPVEPAEPVVPAEPAPLPPVPDPIVPPPQPRRAEARRAVNVAGVRLTKRPDAAFIESTRCYSRKCPR